MPTYDPALYRDQLSEVPVETEVAMTVLQILKELRGTLALLGGMQQTWNLNGIPDMVQAAITNNELLAGHSPQDWYRWGVVFTELQTWLGTPIASIGQTPLQVLMKRYVAQEAQP